MVWIYNDKYIVELWLDCDSDMLTYVWLNHVCISYLWMINDDVDLECVITWED
jgi:hypothetical protein